MRPNSILGKWILPFFLCLCASVATQAQETVFSGGASKSLTVDGHTSTANSAAWQSLHQGQAESQARPNSRALSGDNQNGSANSNRVGRGGRAGTSALRSGGAAVVSAAYRPNSPMQGEQSPQQESMPLEPPTIVKSSEGQGSGGSTIQMVTSIGSSLLIVIGLFLGATWCYKKTVNTTLSGGIPKQVVKVLGRTPLAARQQLVLVRFGPKLVLVSLVQGEARAISEITDPVQVDQLSGFCESQSADSSSQSFRNILNQGVLK